ncbi:MAG: hypothetical protein IPM29_01310 [Planctomycetes bacterium]|nr:hypothetical protein [Planctomycetota bacterium]
MDIGGFDREAAHVGDLLPAGPRVAVIGSTSFWHGDSSATCSAIGAMLAGLEGTVLLTGGVEGVGEATGRGFFAARPGLVGARGVYHVLPRGSRTWDYGDTLFAGSDLHERREILGRLSGVYVVVEGGPGTEHEAGVAIARAALVVPVGRSGGSAGDLHSRLAVDVPEGLRDAWSTLGHADSSPTQVAGAVLEIVRPRLTCR